MTKLKAVEPVIVEKRLKMLVYGPSGVGKTTAAIQFPNAYIIDTEKGSDFYSKTIKKANSVVLKSSDPDEIKNELKLLKTERHPYKTLIVDPITQVYNATQEKWSHIFEKYTGDGKNRDLQDFGPRYWGRVKSDFKSIQRILMSLDMNVIITSHQKDIYGTGMTKIGVGPDTMKGDEYIFDLVFELKKAGDRRIAFKIKERAEIGENRFPNEFEWSYPNFLKYYGSDIIEKPSEPQEMATEDQIKKLLKLLEIVQIESGQMEKWLKAANAESYDDLPKDKMEKIISFIEKKMKDATNGGKK